MKLLNLILLIDDDETTNFINNRTLAKANIAREIRIYKDATEALVYLQQTSIPGFIIPELIFLDIKMPKMDGYEFLEEYRRLNKVTSISSIIMMLTSSASFYDLKRLEEYEEVKKHFSKPLTAHDIKEIITEYFPQNMPAK